MSIFGYSGKKSIISTPLKNANYEGDNQVLLEET